MTTNEEPGPKDVKVLPGTKGLGWSVVYGLQCFAGLDEAGAMRKGRALAAAEKKPWLFVQQTNGAWKEIDPMMGR